LQVGIELRFDPLLEVLLMASFRLHCVVCGDIVRWVPLDKVSRVTDRHQDRNGQRHVVTVFPEHDDDDDDPYGDIPPGEIAAHIGK
jgi:hypothetical protein